MSEQYLFLSFPQRSDSPSPPAIPTIELSPFLTIDRDGANVTMMKLTSHTGTHLDTPRHVFSSGLTITDFGPGDFVFHSPLVLDLPLDDTAVVMAEHLEPFVSQGQDADLLLFRFGYAEVRRADKQRYSTKSPGFGVESAQFLRDNFPNLRALGMDVPSLSCIEYLDDTFEAHHALLSGEGRKFLVLEDLNLEYDLAGLRKVFVAPLRVDNLDGGPCTILGMLD